MRSLRLLAVAAAVLLFAAPSVGAQPAASVAPVAAHPLTKADADAWLDGFIPYALKHANIPGAVVVVVKDGQVVTERGFGYADVAARTPVDPMTTLFRPGSITKTFTWTAVMQLVEQGKLDLDADVNRYLDFKIPPYQGQPVTLREIMTHTTGFEDRQKDLMANGPKLTLEQYVKSWTPHRVFAPGKVPAYSNYGAAVAGYIVQRVSGEPWADYVQRHILTPLDMAHSSAAQPFSDSVRAHLAKGYKQGASGPAWYQEFIPAAPAGGLAVSGDDMAHFMIAQLQNGRYGSVQILKPETAIAMHATRQPRIYPAINDMTLGLYEASRNGHRVIAHKGGTQVFLSDLYLFVDDNTGLFISLNSAGNNGEALQIHDGFFHGFADRYFPDTRPVPATLDKSTALAHAKQMAGLWEDSRRSLSNFVRLTDLFSPLKIAAGADGTLTLTQGGEVSHWRETAPFVWTSLQDREDQMQAVLKNGRPAMLGVGFQPKAFTPVPAWRSPAWIGPALFVAIAVLLLSVLFWPLRALARRKYGAPFALQGRDALVYRAANVFALAAAVVFVGYVMLLQWLFADFSHASKASDPLILAFGVSALVSFVGAAVFALWNAGRVWRSGGGWFGKVWSALVAASALMLLWSGWLFHLMGVNTWY